MTITHLILICNQFDCEIMLDTFELNVIILKHIQIECKVREVIK